MRIARSVRFDKRSLALRSRREAQGLQEERQVQEEEVSQAARDSEDDTLQVESIPENGTGPVTGRRPESGRQEVSEPTTEEDQESQKEDRIAPATRRPRLAKTERAELAARQNAERREREAAQGYRRSSRKNRGTGKASALTVLSARDILIQEMYEEALKSPQAVHWQQAIDDELEALRKNRTWRLEEMLVGVNIIDSKWVLSLKLTPDGGVSKYKAGLVARGFTQEEGVDYGELFALTVQYSSIRFLLAWGARRG